MQNPLLEPGPLPPFSEIRPEHVQPAIRTLLAEGRALIETLVEQARDPDFIDWAHFVEPLSQQDERLGNAWSPVSHLHSVMDNDALRDVYNACLPLLADYGTEIGQNRDLFQAYKTLQARQAAELDPTQQKIITDTLRDFRLAGVALEGDERVRYAEIKRRLSELSSTFEQNILDATMAWQQHITDNVALAGLPASALAQAKQAATDRDLSGYLLTLEFPSYFATITYAEDRALRQQIYTAYATRASDQGPQAGQFDNSAPMVELLTLRQELAVLLGYESYAQLSLATKMADSPTEVFDFLNDLVERSRPQARQEFQQLQQFAKQLDGIESLQAWDIAYYSEKLREQRYAINQEALRPYFPEQTVIQGLFTISAKLYGVHYRQRDDVSGWHPDVRYFDVLDDNEEVLAGFYFDLYARPHKRGGAWMDVCRSGYQLQTGAKHIPVAYLSCNLNAPVAETPALFTHDEVVTLFHEFGHGLHHMLSRVPYPQVSGISGVPWDAVELPSQFNENFCYQKESLALMSGHYETAEALDDATLDRLLAAKNFQSAMTMVRQLEFSLFDFELYSNSTTESLKTRGSAHVQSVLDAVRSRVAVVAAPEFNRFQHSFSHIFSGGYAAGYYSYKWAEVLSADAFSSFEEEGVLNPATGARFLDNILARGGAEEPLVLFRRFRGREPDIKALLRHNGIKSVG